MTYNDKKAFGFNEKLKLTAELNFPIQTTNHCVSNQTLNELYCTKKKK